MPLLALAEADVLTGCKHLLDALKASQLLTYRRLHTTGVPLRQGTRWGIRKNSEMKGMSDMLIFLPNQRVLHVELKSTLGSLSPEQKQWRDELNSLGHSYYLVRSVEDLRQALLIEGVVHWAL